MTVKAFAKQAQLLRYLRGEPCVRAGEGGWSGTLLLDFTGHEQPDDTGHERPMRSVVVECAWRLETQDRVLAGHMDDMEQINAGVSALIGKNLLRYRVHRPSFTALLHFTGGYTLWIFPDSVKDFEDSDDPSSSWFVTGSALPDDSWQ